ncbi:hypothetical protein [Rhizobacter sp. OV335]|jgi:hypothetical protein|uniref:hypothetical protein n=1 Tax=Rhizobacter sp. OV335 TaxID=1500264 RepID=UPI00091172C0|nr:hypothetical protein [Rhizobacter sp. OV335]SHN37788.1 hypothetical protein SAMN02787076_05781 [Rhizobacter sp. OV335]
MSRRNLHGINSILIGVLALWLVAGIKRLQIYRDTHAGYLLEVLERVGWIADPSRGDAQLKAWDPFSLNDGTAIVAASGFGIYLALAGIGSALWAQWRDEDNLYLSAGFMCGSCALVYANYAWGMAAMLAGAVAMLLLRSRKRKLSPR